MVNEPRDHIDLILVYDNGRQVEMKRIIITGASGPIGIVLIKECIKNGCEVLAIVRAGSPKKNHILEHENVKVIESELPKIEQLPELVKEQYDICFHLAWTHTGDEGRNNPFLQEKNIEYTLKVAECAYKMGCKVFVGAGSQAEYGVVNHIINEETPVKPVTLYGITKLAAGQLVMEYCRQKGMRCNWVRIFAVYGPYENPYIFTSYLIRNLLDGKEVELTPCEQKWDYLYCEDVVKALYLVANNVKDSGVYCLGSGQAVKMKEYVHIIFQQLGIENESGIGKRSYGQNQIMHLQADISKLQQDTGFVPAVSFEEGIVKTIDWYRENENR